MASKSEQKFRLFESMIGTGIFSLLRAFGSAADLCCAIIGWGLAGGGLYMPYRVFQTFTNKHPDIEPGIPPHLSSGLANPATGE